MRRLVVSEYLTLDRVMQAPGDPNEHRSGGFDDGGWQLQVFDDVFGDYVMQGFATTGAFLLGRLTYDNFAAFWPNQPADDPVAGPMNATPKYVVSTTLTEPLTWQNSTLIRDDVAGSIRRLKEEDGKDIQVIGSGELVQTLAREGPRRRVPADDPPDRARHGQAAVPRRAGSGQPRAHRREADGGGGAAAPLPAGVRPLSAAV